MEESHPATIVVVEDEKIIRLAIVKYLTIEGFDVMAAENGADAMRILETKKIDLILSDILMPVMDGVAFYQKVQEDPKHRQIPFLFLTALSDQEHMMVGRELGVDDYLTKPIDRDVLLASVRGRLKRAAGIRESHALEIEGIKKDVLNSLSDEVKLPVNIIRNLSTLLLDRKVTVSSDQMADVLRSIKAAGDRLQRGLDDFVMSLELDSGAMKTQYEAEKAKQDLWNIVSQVVSRSVTYANRKRVQVEWIPLSERAPVLAAPKQLGYIIDRVVYSAFASSNPGARVEVSGEVGDQQATIVVKGGGAGINQNDLPRIFDKYHSIRQIAADEFPIGLSLYTAKRLSEVNKCDLSCTSQPGKGMTFRLRIPTS